MAALCKFPTLCLFFLVCQYATGEDEPKEELVSSESKDGKLEIIKQIKKVNNDGSYTIGYEADDGSFKIESRDVLGNVKGTYGYVDDSGQIKRVSYSTSNSSEVIAKPPEVVSSVVQRIPKTNRTYTTKRPTYHTTTPSGHQRLKISTSTSTTETPNYSEVVSIESEMGKTTNKPLYQSSTPRILLQGRPIVRSTPASQIQKSEGQLVRPEIVTIRPTELPLFRRLALKHHLLSDNKPVNAHVEHEEKSNILRRQLNPEKFNPQQHVFMIQQSSGNDNTDVYGSSVTTGTPRPLFTTTSRPRILLSSTAPPSIISRPGVRYQANNQRLVLQDLEPNSPEYAQESTTTQAPPSEVPITPTPVPILQIPANRPQEPLVAIRHPFQRGTILVPLSQLQRGEVVDAENGRHEQPEPTEEPRTIYVRRLPSPQFRPIPVQVDENGYIRDLPPQANIPPSPYPPPVPVTPPPRYSPNDNDIDGISPPVSTRDFQKLLQQLILRQSRLERISALTDPRRHPEYYQPPPRYRPAYRPPPYYVQRVQQEPQTGPAQFLQNDQRFQQFVRVPQQGQDQNLYQGESYVPTRRVARLLPQQQEPRNEPNEEYLPPDVREMLLLRMLQLAINPALPLNEDETVEETTSTPQYKQKPVRNVEILGEEQEQDKRPTRIKRYKNPRGYFKK